MCVRKRDRGKESVCAIEIEKEREIRSVCAIEREKESECVLEERPHGKNVCSRICHPYLR